jgi:hypothetical protein
LHLSEVLIAVSGVRLGDERYQFLAAAGKSDQFVTGDEFDVRRLISRRRRS